MFAPVSVLVTRREQVFRHLRLIAVNSVLTTGTFTSLLNSFQKKRETFFCFVEVLRLNNFSCDITPGPVHFIRNSQLSSLIRLCTGM
jgi:hypothetical protein